MKWPMTWPMTRWMMKHRQILGVSIVVLLAGALGESAHNDFQYPWTAGKSYLASQGWNGIYMKGGTCISGGSHTKAFDDDHAWDFRLPLNTPVLAAKAGTAHVYKGVTPVTCTDTTHSCYCGGGPECENAVLAVWITHDDGTES